MKTLFIIDVWYGVSLIALFIFYYSLYQSFSETSGDGLGMVGIALIVVGMVFSMVMANQVINHRKNIVLWVSVQLAMWLGLLVLYYPLYYRKQKRVNH